MKKIICICLLHFLLGLSTNSFAQIPSLGFDTSQGFPLFIDSIPLGGADSVSLKIKNYGSSTFSGTVSLERQIKDSTGLIVSPASLVSSQQATITLGSVFPFLYFETYDASKGFFLGIDVVVIWPKASSGLATTHDSLSYTVVIKNPTSVSKILAENGIRIYPNPFVDKLTIENKEVLNPIEQVRVYDLKGKLILTKTREDVIDLSQIPDAVYVVELFYKSGMRKVMKVQKQKDK